jgi:hypothetical protein
MPDGQRVIYDLRFTVYEVKIEARANRMNRHCHHCGEPWTLNGQPGRGETCLKCRADLRVCLNCAHYDPRVAEQCRERRAELVQEKHVGTFCEYFEFALRVWAPKTGDNRREATAREQLKKLLGD